MGAATDGECRPTCAHCGERMWWNVRRRVWRHYFDDGTHDAVPLKSAAPA